MGVGGLDIGLALGRGIQGGVGAFRADEKAKQDKAREDAQNLFEEKRIELQQMLAKVADDRYNQGRKDDQAAQTASTLDPWQEVDPTTQSQLEGTPYAGHVSQRSTLPSSTIPMPGFDAPQQRDAGGDPYAVWTPTTKDAKAWSDDRAKSDFVGTLTGPQRQAATAREHGIALDPSDFADPAAAAQTKEATHQRDRRESFEDWQKREEWTRAHPTAAQPGGKDDPEMPRGVESYLYDLSRRQGNTFEQARSEIDQVWNQLVTDHPKISRVKVNQALRGFFQKDPGASPDPLAGLGLEPPTPPAGRSSGAGPVAASTAGAPARPAAQPRTVTKAQVEAVAKKNGTTYEEERRRAAAEGFVIR